MKSDRRKVIRFTCPWDPEIKAVLDKIGRTGMKKGYWLMQAVRERMEREGLLPAKKG